MRYQSYVRQVQQNWNAPRARLPLYREVAVNGTLPPLTHNVEIVQHQDSDDQVRVLGYRLEALGAPLGDDAQLRLGVGHLTTGTASGVLALANGRFCGSGDLAHAVCAAKRCYAVAVSPEEIAEL